MAHLDDKLIRMKLEKLRHELKQGPPIEMLVEARTEWLRVRMIALVEILLYLGT